MNYIDFIVVAAYILLFVGLGVYFRDNKSGKDYFLGGKSFGWFPLSLSTAATQLSAISFISAPAFVGLKAGGGLQWLTFELAVPMAMLFLMVFLVPPMYKSGIVSVYAFLEERYSKSTRMILSVVFQLSRALGTGIMIYTTALILMAVMQIPMWITIIIIGIVTILYSYMGGMKAVVYGDMIQMIILLIGMLVCLFAGLHYLGGWDAFVQEVDIDRATALDFSSTGFDGSEFGFWPMLLGGFFLYISYYGTDQSQVQRLFSASSMKTVKQTLLSNGLMRFPITLLYCLMGLVLGTLVVQQASFAGAIPSDKPDLMVPIFIRDYLPHGLIGILMVAIFSAAMSSLSSAINSLSAATLEDIIDRDKTLDEQSYMRYSKRTAILWGVVCVIMAFFAGEIADTVIEAINKVGSLSFGPIVATFIAAMAIRRIGAVGANAGLIAGVLGNIILWKFVPDVFWIWWNLIGAVVACVVALVVSTILGERNEHTMSLGDFDFDKGKAGILVAFFIIMVAICYCLPGWLAG